MTATTGPARARFDKITSHTGGIVPEHAYGFVWTPNLPGRRERIVVLLDDTDNADMLAWDKRGDSPEVTNLLTGEQHTFRAAECGLGCRCAIEIV